MQKVLEATERIRKDSSGSGKLQAVLMDMDSLESVKEAARTFLSSSDKLNILVNNAGMGFFSIVNDLLIEQDDSRIAICTLPFPVQGSWEPPRARPRTASSASSASAT